MFNFIKRSSINQSKDNSNIVSIADGKLIDIKTVTDEVFSSEMMGQSVAFQLEGDTAVVASPITGSLDVVFPTGHSFGVKDSNGLEIIIHIGIDTSKTNGEGFKILKHQGSIVNAGEAVIEVDLKKLASKGYDTTTMLIITSAGNQTLKFIEPQPVKKGQSILYREGEANE